MRFAHIFIGRIKRIADDGVLWTLDFTNFSTSIDCIKGKQTNKTIKGAKRSIEIPEIIHTTMYRPFSIPYLYLIVFINDPLRYMYLYFLKHKEEVHDAFKIYKL